jgi:hypothetical protein
MTFLADVTGSPFYDLTVENGKTYHYSVRAMNVLGISEPSITVSATIPDLTAPGTPRNLVLSLDPDGVIVSWVPPASDGGSPITGYVIFRSNGTGALSRFVELGDVLTYLDESVVNGSTYRYAVLAVNSVGEGPMTPEGSINVPGSPVTDDDDEDDGDDDDEDDDDDMDEFPWWVLIVLFIMMALVIFVILLITIVFASTRKGPQEEE